VLFQYPNVADLLEKLGVKVESVKSTPLKAAPDGFEPTSPEARAALNSIIQDSYAWFKGIVQDRRHLNDSQLQTAADGRVFTGHQAIDLKLIDELGDERTALAWLGKEKKIDTSLPVRNYNLHSRFSDLSFLHAAGLALLDAVGLSTLADRLELSTAMQGFNLDGLLAFWHPADAR
jgi:protease IV